MGLDGDPAAPARTVERRTTTPDRTEAAMTRPDEDLTLGDHLDPDERDPEAPPADVAEQATPARPGEAPSEVRRGWEVGEWDAAEQAVVVDFDDDDYR
jgi:hypothetical protein